MSAALLTGVSGLIAHQRLLDVVGNNIANVNTHGYKSQQVLFSDLFYETLSPATSPRAEGVGGTNGNQIGRGVQLSQIDRDFSDGAQEASSGQFHMAISDGFFVVREGNADYYTRAGVFEVDAQGVLVTPSGFEVQRLPFVGEANGVSPGFQVPGDSRIHIPQDAFVPAVPTTEIAISGNFPSTIAVPAPSTRTSQSSLTVESTDSAASESTLLNDLAANFKDYVNGDKIHITGEGVGGNAIIDEIFDVSETTTVGDLIAAINQAATGFQATLTLAGQIVLTAQENGPKEFSLQLADMPTNTGATQFTTFAFSSLSKGTNEGVKQVTSTVIDPRGIKHEITLVFTRMSYDRWTVNVGLTNPNAGTVDVTALEPIEFTDDGRLKTQGDQTIAFNLDGFGDTQFVRLSFDPETRNQGADATVSVDDDGYESGLVTSYEVDADGTIYGRASNGQVVTMARMAIASFQNEKGLEGVGNSLFASSLNSGDPEIGAAASGRRGAIKSGVLEASNVDVAYEFTRLIVAQRGFSANARTITVADKVLEELTNIVR